MMHFMFLDRNSTGTRRGVAVVSLCRTFVPFLSVGFRRVYGMSAVQAEPPSTDGLVARLDEVLAELADAVADTTTYINGRGACDRGNQVREMSSGWRIKLIDYLSRVPDPP